MTASVNRRCIATSPVGIGDLQRWVVDYAVRPGVFVTADSRYVSRVADSGAVIALADWQPPQTPSRPNKQ